ncbi:MAG TPA: hypothetical protein EYG98_01470 [Sulfurovum sp.]|nr:hypothetical protein [Sulfurovum sp.]
MQAIYHIDIDELNIDFFNMLKKQFSNAKLDIVIKEYNDTDYLNSSIANKNMLEEAISQVNEGNLIDKSIDELNL